MDGIFLKRLFVVRGCVGLFLASAFSCAMAPTAVQREPIFKLGQQAVPAEQNPVLFGYRRIADFKCPVLKDGQKVLIPRSDRSFTFAQLEEVNAANVKVSWRERGVPMEKVMSKDYLYVHATWNRCAPAGETFLPNFACGMRHYDSLAEWIERIGELSAENVFFSGGYFESFCDEAYKILRENVQAETSIWFENKNIFRVGADSASGQESPGYPPQVGMAKGDAQGSLEHCYVQKLYMHHDDTVNFFGDIHGDVVALIRALQKLAQDGLLGDDFVLTNAHTYLVFLGDYVDRGPCSIEVLYLLLTLKLKNPNQVVLLRGNHEDSSLCELYGFGQELKNKFDYKAPERMDIYRLYDLLPVALYLGCQEAQEYAWALCCHAAPEIGFSAREFLVSDAQYGWLEKIRRNYYIDQLPQDVRDSVRQAHKLPKLNTFLARTKRVQGGESKGEASSTPAVCQGLVDIGFLWNDFIVDGLSDEFRFNELRGCQFGQRLTKALMDRDNLHMLVRGHQHNGPLLEQLYQNNGYVKLFNGRVRTLMSGNIVPSRQELNYAFVRLAFEPKGRTRDTVGWHMQSVSSRQERRPSQDTQPFDSQEPAEQQSKKQKKSAEKK